MKPLLLTAAVWAAACASANSDLKLYYQGTFFNGGSDSPFIDGIDLVCGEVSFPDNRLGTFEATGAALFTSSNGEPLFSSSTLQTNSFTWDGTDQVPETWNLLVGASLLADANTLQIISDAFLAGDTAIVDGSTALTFEKGSWHISATSECQEIMPDLRVPGDANLDGKFDSSDLVQVFQFGEYEDDVLGNSDWGEGDWNSDGEFDSGDLVAAFQFGAYEKSSPRGIHVPEPSFCTIPLLLLLFSMASARIGNHGRRRRC